MAAAIKMPIPSGSQRRSCAPVDARRSSDEMETLRSTASARRLMAIGGVSDLAYR
jgi:hypothetical protein